MLLSTSTGQAGARRVLEQAKLMVANAGGDVIDAISLPEFHRHYDAETGEVHHPDTARRVRDSVHRMLLDAPVS